MEALIVTVLEGHGWNEKKQFQTKSTHGMVINFATSFEELLSQLRNLLRVTKEVQNLHISYLIDEAFTPTVVDNDVSLGIYLQVKNSVRANIGAFPMCVELRNREIEGPSNLNEAMIVARDDFNSVDGAHNNNSNDMISLELPLRTDNTSYGYVSGDLLESKIHIDAIFETKQEFKEALQMYALRSKFQYVTKTSHPEVLHVVCFDINCKWAVRGVMMKDTKCFKVKRCDDVHTCSIDHRLNGSRQASAAIIGKLVKHEYMDASRKPYQPKCIMADLRRSLGVKMNYHKAWRAKECALRALTGSDFESYMKLPGLCYMLRKTNPGSHIALETDCEQNFKYFFMALDAWLKGWQWCRPIIIVDGSFMKATFRGTLLTACALDANRQIFPIGFGVCDRENNETWKWFFTKLKEGIGERQDMCVVSDRNEGIINAVKQVFPCADHGYCVQHILGNITTKFRGKKKRVTDLVNAAARAPTGKLCEYLLGLLDDEDPRIRAYLNQIGKKNGLGPHLSRESTQF